MRRDNKLVLVILRFVQRFHTDCDHPLSIQPSDILIWGANYEYDESSHVDDHQFYYHLNMLIDHGLLSRAEHQSKAYSNYNVQLTWAGHDYLDANRDVFPTDLHPYHYEIYPLYGDDNHGQCNYGQEI